MTAAQALQQQTTVTVRNVAPIANIGGDRTLFRGQTLSVSPVVDDPCQNDGHTYLWQVINSNQQEVFRSTQKDLSYSPANIGVYTARFTVSDDDGGVDPDPKSFVLTVTHNTAPLEVMGTSHSMVAAWCILEASWLGSRRRKAACSPLVSLDGSLWSDGSVVHGDGTVAAAVGGVTAPLFSARSTFPYTRRRLTP